MNRTVKLLAVVLGFVLIVGAASAAGNAQVVKLIAKEPVDTGAWPWVEDGAFGSLMYQQAKFTFTGHGLAPKTEYALVNYYEDWPNVAVLGTAMTDKNGNIQIKGGSTTLIMYEYPTSTSDEYSGWGAKVWLVPKSDLSGNVFIAWNPLNYLFETSLVV